MHTNLPAAELVLLAMLQTAPALSAVTVTYSGPVTDAQAVGQHLYFASNEFTQDWRGGFGGSRDDSFVITLVAWAYQAGNDEQTARTRCWSIVTAVQDVVSSDPSLGGVLNIGAGVIGGNVVTAPADPSGWASRAEIRVGNAAVLTS